MPIDSRTAAEVARRAGLDLSAAHALSYLADTPAEAKELAAMFTTNADDAGPDSPTDMADKVVARRGY